MITKPEEAVPDSIEIAIITAQECIDKGRQAPLFFTAAECAEIAKAYGEICRFTRKVHYILKESEHGSKRQRRIFGLWKRCIIARQAWEYRFAEWEKGQ